MEPSRSEHEWTAQQRAGQVTIWLVQGNRLKTADIARLTGMTFQGARYMMLGLSMVLPIEHSAGRWQWIRGQELDHS